MNSQSEEEEELRLTKPRPMAMVSSHTADRGDEVAASATRGGVVWKNDDRRLFFNRNHGGFRDV